MTILFGQGAGTWNSELGEFISDDHVRLARVIHDYKPTLSLVYIPKKDQTGMEKPWAIVENDPRFPSSIIRYLSNEDMQNPQAILAWIVQGDMDRVGRKTLLDRIETEATAARLLELARQQDELDDMADHFQFYLTGGREKKHTLNMGNGKKVERG
jgi:hypothetical protein